MALEAGDIPQGGSFEKRIREIIRDEVNSSPVNISSFSETAVRQIAELLGYKPIVEKENR